MAASAILDSYDSEVLEYEEPAEDYTPLEAPAEESEPAPYEEPLPEAAPEPDEDEETDINIYAVDISEDSGYVGAHFAEDDGSDDDDDYNEPPQYPDNVVKTPD